MTDTSSLRMDTSPVSDDLWDNGAASGRRHRMRCISGPKGPCKYWSIVEEVVDYCRGGPFNSVRVSSNKAVSAISRNSSARIEFEYAQSKDCHTDNRLLHLQGLTRKHTTFHAGPGSKCFQNNDNVRSEIQSFSSKQFSVQISHASRPLA